MRDEGEEEEEGWRGVERDCRRVLPKGNWLEPKSDGCFGRMRRRGCCFLCGSGSILKSDLNKWRGKRGIGEESWRVNWNLDGLDGKGVGRVEKKAVQLTRLNRS